MPLLRSNHRFLKIIVGIGFLSLIILPTLTHALSTDSFEAYLALVSPTANLNDPRVEGLRQRWNEAVPSYIEYRNSLVTAGTINSNEEIRAGTGLLTMQQWINMTPSERNLQVAQSLTRATQAPAARESVKKQVEKIKDTLATCAGNWWDWLNPSCLMRAALSWIGAALIWIGVTSATAAGSVFDAATTYLIVDFGKYLNNPAVKSAIDAGWSTLRDMANIVIIGMFVFIAINIILGVKEFGDKKKVARVLIVAVLINFSLLFTKVIVDASNFTAYQVHRQISGVTRSDTQQTGTSIASRFMKNLEVTGIVSTDKETLNKIAETNKDAFYALAAGLFALIFLLAVAFVLLYGAFLIASRAVLIVFLMLASAIAFASWLLPQQYAEKGFMKWWESLLKTAFFAPILMALLWITMNVSDAFVAALGRKGTLGGLAGNASSEANAIAFIGFIIVLGLLYASFVIASAFSKTIPAFRFGTGAVATPLSGASRVAGFAGRGLIGAPSGWVARKIQATGWPAEKGLKGWLGYYAQAPFASLAKTPFDALTSKPVQKFVEGMGGYTFGDKIGVGGHWGAVERAAERLEKQARAIAPSAEARKRHVESAGEAEKETIRKELQTLETQKTAAEENRKTAEKDAERARAEAEEKHAGGKEARDAAIAKHQEAEDRAGNSERELEAVRRRYSQAIASAASDAQANALRSEQTEKINSIRTRLASERAELAQSKSKLDAMREVGDAVAKTIVEPHEEKLREINEDIAERIGKAAGNRIKKVMEERDVALQGPAIAKNMARWITKIGRRNELQHQLGGVIKKKDLQDFAAAVAKAGGTPPSTEAPAPAPPTPPTHT